MCLTYLNARWGFSLKFGTEMWGHLKFVCEAPNRTHQTGSLWTRPCRAKPRPASQNHVRSVLFWVTTQRGGVIPYWHFGTSPSCKGHKIQKREHSTREVNWHSLFLGVGEETLSTVWFFKELQHFGIRLYFCFQAKKHLTWWTPWIALFSITGHHRNSNLLRYVPENRSSPRVVTGKWLLKN